MKPLNPSLYSRLKFHFGSVQVANEGEAMIAKVSKGLYDDDEDKLRLSISHPGEYYKVNCPYCGDTRHRLWVSHQYGQRDEAGRRMTFLAVCYNEEACMQDYDNVQDLWDTLSGQTDLEHAKVRQGKEVPMAAREVDWPGPCIPIEKLKAGHKARRYLEGRGYDPDHMGKYWGYRYCVDSYYFLARNRIIIPVYEHGKLKGWQARYVGELDWHDKTKDHPPKYFTLPGMPRRLLLYNWDRCKQWETGVIVEGPTDVVGFGPMACCTFGSTMTPWQVRKFLTAFRRRSAVLLYDPDACDLPATKRLIKMLRKRIANAQAALVRLPEGTDPGSLDRDFLRSFVRDEAKAQGVKVSWKKVSAPIPKE